MRIEKGVEVVRAATVHDVVDLRHIHRYGVITRAQDPTPNLDRTTSVYVYVSHGNISKCLLIFALPCFIIADLKFDYGNFNPIRLCKNYENSFSDITRIFNILFNTWIGHIPIVWKT